MCDCSHVGSSCACVTAHMWVAAAHVCSSHVVSSCAGVTAHMWVAAAHVWQLHKSSSCACVTTTREWQLRMCDSYTQDAAAHVWQLHLRNRCACVTATRKLQLLIYNSDRRAAAAHVWQLHVSTVAAAAQCACALLSIPEILGLLQQLCSTPGVQIGIQIIKVKWRKKILLYKLIYFEIIFIIWNCAILCFWTVNSVQFKILFSLRHNL